jgi:hypothetical protein
MDDVLEIAKKTSFRVTRNRIEQILDELGYAPWGRALRPLMPNESKPVLYRHRDNPMEYTSEAFDHFLKSNGLIR